MSPIKFCNYWISIYCQKVTYIFFGFSSSFALSVKIYAEFSHCSTAKKFVSRACVKLHRFSLFPRIDREPRVQF